MMNRRNGSAMCQSPTIYSVDHKKGWFGNPAIRAVSKLCSSVMQLTLKVKSGVNVENLSPTLSLMSGSTTWLVIARDGSISVHNQESSFDPDRTDTTCSLYEISHAPTESKIELVRQFINIVLIECRRQLDIAEYNCLTLLLCEIVKFPLHEPMGIQTIVGHDYSEFSPFTVFSASFVDPRFIKSYGTNKRPSTIAEYMFLRHFQDIPSIL